MSSAAQESSAQSRRAEQLEIRHVLDTLQGPLLVALCYFLGAELAFYVGTLSDRVFALFWPPNVLLFFALLIVPRRRWWLYIAAAFPAHTIAEVGVGMPWFPLLLAFLTNCAAAALSAYLVESFIGERPWFGKFRNAAWYIVITAGISPAIAALGGAFVPILSGGKMSDYGIYWTHWYLANAIPNITLGPAFLTWYSVGATPSSWKPSLRHVEPVLLIAALIVACVGGVTAADRETTNSSFVPALLLSPLPILLWAAVRFGQRGASSALFVVATILIWATLHGLGPFNDDEAGLSVLALQLFLTGLAIPVLLLGALIDELRGAALTMQHLAASVVGAQDEERRRIARDLHDSTGQNLIAASLLIGRLEKSLLLAGEPVLRQVDHLLKQATSEIRTVSYVLHPPILDEAGLDVALRSFAEGYAERSGVAVSFDVARDFGRLPADTELILFRVVQEALTNVARHSDSPTAHIHLARRRSIYGQHAVVTIKDAGRGMPPAALMLRPICIHHRPRTRPGIGLVSMRERLSQIGGRLEISSVVGGTTLTAIAPIPHTRMG
jgi:glucose-6-phosphate-specific signal transduction histidine kinase